MAAINKKLKAAAEAFFKELRRIRQSGVATDERSTYFPLATLLTAVGATLKPKVFCVVEPIDQGAGHPDLYLYVEKQLQRGQPHRGQEQTPERGVVEVKAPGEDTREQTVRDQVSRYWQRYHLVLVTNLCEFELVGQDEAGEEVRLESFQLANSEESLDRALQTPRAFATRIGVGLGEYLCRALSHKAALTEPKDLAWLLASYARDGLARVEQAGDTPSLRNIRQALEQALGVRFEGERGAHFFHSTLIQTLFYGVFSAWVLWTRSSRRSEEQFRWQEAVWHLRVPVLKTLFHQLADPTRLEPLGLVNVLDWTGAALNRVDRTAFFQRFNEGEAVPYFYEPFLQAFDPQLRKQLGVWYTPSEVVRYMVARVDKALKDDLGIADGLAAENVYVLDPCCGTGAYLAEVLRRIAANLQGQGLGALVGARVRQAALQRVFGFEIMPAPFVVAHLQVGLTLQDLDAELAEGGEERVGVYLTNALTGWEPTDEEKQVVAFPELDEERDRANEVKRNRPILVILGNPPYNGFAGMAVDEERELSESYRSTNRVRRPEGQGLNDLYVRFFRMAERRIAEKTGRGIVCFISNYSWLDGLSFTGMRERYLQVFDSIRIDNLHGDRIISEYAPDGRTSETVFAILGQSPGIRIGTNISMLCRSGGGGGNARDATVMYRDFEHAKAVERRVALLKSLEADDLNAGYSLLEPHLKLGLPFKPMAVSDEWFDWPSLPDLFPVSFPGVKTSRDPFLVDIDKDRLEVRIADYFNDALSHEEIARRYPAAMKSTARFDALKVRAGLLERGRMDADAPDASEAGDVGERADGADRDHTRRDEPGLIRFAYRPFDNRWLYWEKDTKLLDEKRAQYRPHVFEGSVCFVTQQKPRRDWSPPQVISHMGCLDLMDRGATCIPARLDDVGADQLGSASGKRPNLSASAEKYLAGIGASVEDLFHHALAVLHDPAYREANAGALRMEWPRIPLPGRPDGQAAGAAEVFAASAARGRELARLLDSDTPVPGVTQGDLRPEIASVAVPATTDGRNMAPEDFAVSAGWGHYGAGQAVMPGTGRTKERDYTYGERSALGNALPVLGESTFDIYLNERAFWRNVPAAVWNYKLGGYQVIKKWLSYREQAVLGRPLTPEEIHHFTQTARRITAILLTTEN